MATKPTAKKPTKPATPSAAKATKTAKATPALTPKPAAKPVAKPAPAKVAKPSTAKLARQAARAERAARHEKPGTGRVSRGASAEIMRPEGGIHDRRSAAPVAMPSSGLASPFPKDELGQWRQTLLEHRSEISQDISHLEQDAMEAEDGHTTPNHLAERGSDAEMQDMSLGLAGEEQIVLWQIDRALRKIDSGVPLPFGLCEHSKQPIPKTRLQLIPWTPVSIEGMNYVEENGLTLEDILVDG